MACVLPRDRPHQAEVLLTSWSRAARSALWNACSSLPVCRLPRRSFRGRPTQNAPSAQDGLLRRRFGPHEEGRIVTAAAMPGG
jgi:hypothetical protein